MTVATSAASSGPYTGNGGTVAFPFTFKALATNEVAVFANGALVSPSLYTVTLATSGGTVTFTTAPANGVSILIISDPSFLQDAAFQNNGAFLPAVVEAAYDRAAVRDILLKAKVDKLLSTAMLAAARAGYFLSWDADGNPILSSGTGADSGLRTDLAASGGSALTGFLQAGTGAQSETLQAVARRQLYVENFRGTGGKSDLATLTDAFAEWKARGGDLNLEPLRIYDVGTVSTESRVLTMFGIQNATLRGNGATIRCHVNGALVSLLYFADFTNIVIQDLTAEDTSPSFANGATGLRFVVLDTDTGQSATKVTLRNLTAIGCNSFLGVQGTATTRINHIHIEPSCSAEDCFYGLSFQNNGDDVTGGMTTLNCGRSYFPYGVTGHDVAIRIESDGSGPLVDAVALIKRYDRNTSNIRARLTFAGSLDTFTNLVNIEHQNDSGAASIIDDVHIDMHVEPGTTDTNNAVRCAMTSYTAAGVENTGSSAHWTKRLSFSGRLGNATNPHILAHYTPTNPGVIQLGYIEGMSPSLQTVSAPNFLIKTAIDRAYMSKTGSLTAATFQIPIPDFQNFCWSVKLTIHAAAKSASTDGASSKVHYIEDYVGGYSNGAGAGNAAVLGSQRVSEKAFNSSNFAVAYSGGTDVLTLTVTGSDYNVSTAEMKVTMELISRPPIR